MRMIDADALKLSMMLIAPGETKKYCYPCKEILEEIDSAPTIEERKTGKWIHIRDEEDGNALYECSVCHKGEIHVPIVEVTYCWNCGAKMEGEEHG